MSEVRSLRGFKRSMESTPKKRLRSAGGPGTNDQGYFNVPGYAQPTISFSHHKANENTGKILTLKAGASRSKPSTKSNLRAAPKPPRSCSRGKAAHALTGLFNNGGTTDESPTRGSYLTAQQSSNSSPTKNIDEFSLTKGYSNQNTNDEDEQLTLRRPSKGGSYRSPSLARKAEPEKANGPYFTRDEDNTIDNGISSLIEETENLILNHENPLTELRCLFTKSELLGIPNGRSFIPLEEWESLVDYHSIITDKYELKMAKDSELVIKVLELNKRAALESERFRKQLKTTEKEIEILRSTLNLLYKENLKYEQALESVNVKSINNKDITPLSGNPFSLSEFSSDDLQDKSHESGSSVLHFPKESTISDKRKISRAEGFSSDQRLNDAEEPDGFNDQGSDLSEILPQVPEEHVSNSTLNKVQSYFTSLMAPGSLSPTIEDSNPANSTIYDDIYQVLSQPE